MSPLRIETLRYCPNGIKITEIKESDKSFTVGSTDAARILNVPKSTLFFRLRSLGLDNDVPKIKRANGRDVERVFDDNLLLTLAYRFPESIISPSNESKEALTVIGTENAKAILDISWKETVV